uniref:Uncharacterized protein n=1 Tax=Cacopsylla melanoneura TaxID=428564 RepID=A0A8D8QCF1_9HEMI
MTQWSYGKNRCPAIFERQLMLVSVDKRLEQNRVKMPGNLQLCQRATKCLRSIDCDPSRISLHLWDCVSYTLELKNYPSRDMAGFATTRINCSMIRYINRRYKMY